MKEYRIKYQGEHGIERVVARAESFQVINGDVYLYEDDPNLPTAFYSNVVLVEEVTEEK